MSPGLAKKSKYASNVRPDPSKLVGGFGYFLVVQVEAVGGFPKVQVRETGLVARGHVTYMRMADLRAAVTPKLTGMSKIGGSCFGRAR